MNTEGTWIFQRRLPLVVTSTVSPVCTHTCCPKSGFSIFGASSSAIRVSLFHLKDCYHRLFATSRTLAYANVGSEPIVVGFRDGPPRMLGLGSVNFPSKLPKPSLNRGQTGTKVLSV